MAPYGRQYNNVYTVQCKVYTVYTPENAAAVSVMYRYNM